MAVIVSKMTQVATLVGDLDHVDAQIRKLFGFDEGYHEPGMKMFGLENTVQRIGADQYLEVCGQLRDGEQRRAVGGRRGNGGYMAIVEVGEREDIETCRARLEELGLRVVHEIEHNGYHSIHVHPRDLGTIVSFDWNIKAWPGIAPDWPPANTDVVERITAIELRSSNPDVFASRWGQMLGIPVEAGSVTLTGDGTEVRFRDGRPDEQAGMDVIDFRVRDRGLAGQVHDLGGTEFRFV